MKPMDFLDIPYSDHHGFTIPDCWTFDPAPEMKLSNEFQKSLKDTFIFCRIFVDRAHPARPPASAEITNILENQGFWVKSMGLMVPYVAHSVEYEALYSNPANSVTRSVQDANELSRSCPNVS